MFKVGQKVCLIRNMGLKCVIERLYFVVNEQWMVGGASSKKQVALVKVIENSSNHKDIPPLFEVAVTNLMLIH